MFFAARPMAPDKARHLGLLNDLVPREAVEAWTSELAAPICDNAPLAVRVLKQQVRLLSKGHALDAETCEPIQTVQRTVSQSEDEREGDSRLHRETAPRLHGLRKPSPRRGTPKGVLAMSGKHS